MSRFLLRQAAEEKIGKNKEKEMFLFFYIITCFFIFFLRRPVAISIINFQLSTVN